MKRLFILALLVFAVVLFNPAQVLRFDSQDGAAQARSPMGGGMKGRGGGRMSGARARPRPNRSARPAARPRPNRSARPAARPSRPATRPAARPSTRPTKPATRPARPATRPEVARPRPPGAKPSRPERPVAGRPTRPETGRPQRPGTKPTRPERPVTGRPTRPVAGVRPGRPNRPGAGHRPGRPPHVRPPINRPPGWRPPHYRPPHWRPPSWRPPYFRPPYIRPPHPIWGGYYWYPRWGWYFTAAVAGGTLAYVLNLPDTDPCDQAIVDGETLYVCDGTLYRPTVYRDERVYEVVSSQEDTGTGGGISGLLQLTSPRMRGEAVREVQEALVEAGYDVGGIDAIFGPGTDAALRQFQADNGLQADGVVGDETAAALGL